MTSRPNSDTRPTMDEVFKGSKITINLNPRTAQFITSMVAMTGMESDEVVQAILNHQALTMREHCMAQLQHDRINVSVL